jgi:anti-anti-sigma factor
MSGPGRCPELTLGSPACAGAAAAIKAPPASNVPAIRRTVAILPAEALQPRQLKDEYAPRGSLRFAANILDVREDRKADAQALELSGELDAASAPALRERLAEIATRGTGPLVIDLSSLEFIDSTGLSVLINAKRRLHRRGRGLALVCPPGHVHRILEVTKLLETLDCHASREDALGALAGA